MSDDRKARKARKNWRRQDSRSLIQRLDQELNKERKPRYHPQDGKPREQREPDE